ncbi:cobalt-precorrin 5A hydrolase [Desulfurivibrio sp. D14AmB]|uniref:cobalt-precorrin 5A hydrolase n=1 Tax=Desulfurivibrio sp. D14AmB TaxID=3374370 RepID=UPI00376F08C5
MRIGVLALTAGGRQLAAQLAPGLGAEIVPVDRGIAAALAEAWPRYEGLVCIMAAGIVVRAIAPLLEDKERDPAVVVVDERGRHAVSLLSGHLGGGNELAHRVAASSGGRAVITTASDVLALVPLDLWAAAQHLVAADRRTMTRASALLVNRGELAVYSETAVAGLPPGLTLVAQPETAELVISCRTAWPEPTLLMHPRQLVVGIGCNRGTPAEELATALAELLSTEGLAPAAIRNLATIDLKRDEPGLLAMAEQNGWPLEFYNAEQLNGQMANITPPSPAVLKATGAGGVAEPAALLSSGAPQLMIRKRKWKNVTLALAKASFTLSAPDPEMAAT